jgi:UDP-sugar transporter A1/2/3
LKEGFWDGWTVATWIPIVTNSIGGIIVGLVTKYAGSVKKGFALIFGIFLSGVVQALMQPEVGVSKEQAVGGVLAAISLWIHATHPPKEKRD